MSGGGAAIKMETGDQPVVLDSTPGAAKTLYGVAFDAINMRTLLQHKDTELDEAAANVQQLEPFEEEDDDAEE